MKLIHISDLHLDSVFGDYPLEKAKIRRSEMLNTFTRALDYGKETGAEICLVCGDLFDTERVGKAVMENVFAAIALSPMRVIVLKGNHDAVVFDRLDISRLPQNVTLLNFSESFCTEELQISAAPELWNAENFLSLLKISSARVKIIMAHGSMGEGQCLLNPKWFHDSDISYLAMGHIHSYSYGNLGKQGMWVYSGCHEGRGFDETGEKGLVEITVDRGKITQRFVKMSKRSVHEIPVDVSGTENDEARISLLKEYFKNIPSKDCVRLNLIGSCSAVDTAYIEERLKSLVFYVKIKDSTSPPAEAYAKNSLKEGFINEVNLLACDADMKDLIIRYGMCALNGEKIEI